MAKTKKVKSAGRYGPGYGLSLRKKLILIEQKQRKKQKCPFCSSRIKRLSKGIWKCLKCNKKFASDVFYLD